MTSERDLFMVTHLGIARLDLAAWSLEVGGMVGRSRRWTFEELCRLPRRKVTSVHECAGSPLMPLVPQRRAGNVVWSGVALAELLRLSEVSPDATHVWLRGADHGSFAGDECDEYAKDLPMAKALDPDTLLAFEINGEPLPADRGFPVRAVVPGFYGTNSVKWITHVTATDRRCPGLFTTRYYNDAPEDGSGPALPVWALAPNSLIVAPGGDAMLHPRPTHVWGWAWGHEAIARVEVSTDGGDTWRDARLAPRKGWEWQRFDFDWQIPGVGEYRVLSRATDVRGVAQPMSPKRNRSHLKTWFVVLPGTR